ncbi:putative PB1 domain-containing protein [Helianthus debilis subsp. tardiflorus]
MGEYWPEIYPQRKAFCRHGSRAPDPVNNKILSAFRNVKSFPLERIITQFWRLVKTSSGTRLFSTFNPYAYSCSNHRLRKYRSSCCQYSYALSDRVVVDDDAMIIYGAPPSTAILNQFPEVVLGLRAHRGTPLVDLALECELTCFMMLPAFSFTHCVGVIEVSREGLNIVPPQLLLLPCEATTGDFRLVEREIEKALQAAVESHAITLGQVWVTFENLYRKKRRALLGRFKSLCVASPHGDDHMSFLKRFYQQLYVLPLKKAERGLVGRTLETRQAHLCRNIFNFSDNKGVLAVLSAGAKCTSFAICLKSSHMGERDYVFEFFWPLSPNPLPLMEALILTLREYLPSFRYAASGAQLGDELLVVDVEISSYASGSNPTKIFPKTEVSETPKALEETRPLVGMKRKFTADQSELNEAYQYPLTNVDDPKGEDDDDDVVILAVYKVDHSLFFLPSSTTFERLMEKINLEFELNPSGTYKIKYQVLPGEWYSLTDGTCLKSCISSYRTSNNIDHIKLLVLPVEK